ncbi:hypothetical protein CKJ81_09445 [Corynebacterium hadale]|uniref:Uncharacterized protein n=2 Tax=Corynebacterium TaxID=1716 RepID=A0ABX4H7W2_9CORY|nr:MULTISPECIES: hypothetical protein [Corynebacterium]PAT05382.1 hypothetical protein CKJ81_09445 [Corynebacterium hadale]PAT09189.1 hypothetical protein CKJ82_00385 [Corynebacterium hadale]RMD20268.1 hypothetical protein EAW56_03215 [Corynebacterium gottingense]TVX82199.1 hypothetical protein FPP74_01815 [Corynebacterium sp. NML180780]
MGSMTQPETSIRARLQPDVDQFIDDLRTFATGSYLQESDKELWEQPFDPEALPELKQIIEMFLDAFDLIESSPDGERLKALVQPFYDNLEQFNAKHEYAVLEPEEKSELADVVRRAAIASGADDEALGELPDFE